MSEDRKNENAKPKTEAGTSEKPATSADFNGSKKDIPPGKDMAGLDKLKKSLESKSISGKTIDIEMHHLKAEGQDTTPVFTIGPGGNAHDLYQRDLAGAELVINAVKERDKRHKILHDNHRRLIGKYCLLDWKDFYTEFPGEPVEYSKEAALVVMENLPYDMYYSLFLMCNVAEVFRTNENIKAVASSAGVDLTIDNATEAEVEQAAGNSPGGSDGSSSILH